MHREVCHRHPKSDNNGGSLFLTHCSVVEPDNLVGTCPKVSRTRKPDGDVYESEFKRMKQGFADLERVVFWGNGADDVYFSYKPQNGRICDHLGFAVSLSRYSADWSNAQQCHNPPSRPVAIGPSHQADLPEHGLHCTDDDNDNRLAGTCIMPMPTNDSPSVLTPVSQQIGSCLCLDQGSARCVRQHVEEVRKKLRGELGPQVFSDLGFDKIGEALAAARWTEEEQDIFQEVVVARGSSFWGELRFAFPSKSAADLVAYYFNVFVLRMRALQNRVDPDNPNSDDDEWLLGDEEDDDENSTMDSLDGGKPRMDKDCSAELKPGASGLRDSTFPSYEVFHDDSSMSFEAAATAEVGDDGHEGYFFFGSSGSGAIDPKVWAVDAAGFDTFSSVATTGSGKDELLSTHNVIEEVFGNEEESAYDD